jgi:hypothetical protein
MTLTLSSHVLSILILSVICGFVGFGFRRMQDDGMIFEWYRNMLINIRNAKVNTPALCISLFMGGDTTNSNRFTIWLLSKAIKIGMINTPYIIRELLKPLGLCEICNTTWIGIISVILLTKKYTWITLLDCVFVGVASAAVVILISNYYHKLQRE